MKLMLVDDHVLFIEGLSYLLRTYGFEVACVANSGKEALEQAGVHQPEVILMDICMPGLSGFDTLRLLKVQYPAMKVVMLTASQGDEDLFQAIKYGADGYLLKSTSAAKLVETPQGIQRGKTALSSSLAAQLLDELKGCQAEKTQIRCSLRRSSWRYCSWWLRVFPIKTWQKLWG